MLPTAKDVFFLLFAFVWFFDWFCLVGFVWFVCLFICFYEVVFVGFVLFCLFWGGGFCFVFCCFCWH